MPKIKGKFKVQIRRKNKIVNEFEIDNLVTTVGENHMLNVTFAGDTQNLTWFMGLIDNTTFSNVNATDTMASHPGWNEVVAYAETVRQQWTAVSSTASSSQNTIPAQFTMNASASLYGFFITNNNVKGGTTGILWAATPFNVTPAAVLSGDVVSVTYITGLS